MCHNRAHKYNYTCYYLMIKLQWTKKVLCINIILHSSSGESLLYGDSKKESRPFFRTNATLVIPNIAMRPTLDEIQQGLNKAVQSIISCSKGVAQWSKERRSFKKVELCLSVMDKIIIIK